MNLYVLPYEQGLHPRNPNGWFPSGLEQHFDAGGVLTAVASAIDLRETPGPGRCVLATQATIDVSGIGNGRLLANDYDGTVPTLVRTFLRNQLGLDSTELPDVTPRTILRRLFLDLPLRDGTRWQRWQPLVRDGLFDYYEVWLANERVDRFSRMRP